MHGESLKGKTIKKVEMDINVFLFLLTAPASK